MKYPPESSLTHFPHKTVQELRKQHTLDNTQVWGGILGAVQCRWTWMILLSPLQLRIFCLVTFMVPWDVGTQTQPHCIHGAGSQALREQLHGLG